VPARWSGTGFSLIGPTNPNPRPFFPATTEEEFIAKFKKLDREMKEKREGKYFFRKSFIQNLQRW